VLHPLGYHRKGKQCLVNAEEWEEVRVGKPLPNDCLVAEFLPRIHPPFRFKTTRAQSNTPALISASPGRPCHPFQRPPPPNPAAKKSSAT